MTETDRQRKGDGERQGQCTTEEESCSFFNSYLLPFFCFLLCGYFLAPLYAFQRMIPMSHSFSSCLKQPLPSFSFLHTQLTLPFYTPACPSPLLLVPLLPLTPLLIFPSISSVGILLVPPPPLLFNKTSLL